MEKAAELARTKSVGYQLDESNDVGPVVDKAQFEKVQEYIKYGKEQGATLMCGGNVHQSECTRNK